MTGQEKRKSKTYTTLLDKRSSTIREIEYHEKKVSEINKDTSQAEALTRMLAIENSYDKYRKINDELEQSNDYASEDLAPPNEEVIEKYIQIISKLKEFTKESIDPPYSSGMLNSTTRYSGDHGVHLPQINIPTFDGDLLQWTSFYDSFLSMIDSNPNRTNVEKMHYLKGVLKGTALSVINRLPISDHNYKIALNLLKERFNNKRAIVNSCLHTFLFQKSLEPHNSQSVRSLIDTTKESLQCIEALDLPVEHWSALVVFIIQTKLDLETKAEWEQHLGGGSRVPLYQDMINFLEMRYRILETLPPPVPYTVAPYTVQPNPFERSHNYHPKNERNNNASATKKKESCIICKNDHWIFYCPTFDSWSVPQRKNYVHTNALCRICFHQHRVEECRSKYRCKECNGDHNTKLHENNSFLNNATSANEYAPNSVQINHAAVRHQNKCKATAIVSVQDRSGTSHLLRVFVDQGSDGAFISEKAAQLLGLPRKKENIPLTGLDNNTLGATKSSIQITVQSLVNEFKMTLETFVVPTIISASKIDPELRKNWRHLDGLQLADCN